MLKTYNFKKLQILVYKNAADPGRWKFVVTEFGTDIVSFSLSWKNVF